MQNGLNTSLLTKIFTSKEKRDYNRQLHASFSSDGGICLEELTCDEIDDLLPKTDYTYAKTATYSPRYLNKSKYISPNMSRRKIHSSSLLVLSDDEDDVYDNVFKENTKTEDVSYKNKVNFASEQLSESESHKKPGSKSRRRTILTSTPKQYGDHQISTHDHYYDGMLLRSGSRIKGQKYLKDKFKNMDKQTVTSINFSNTEQNKLSKSSADPSVTRAVRNSRSSNDFDIARYEKKQTSQQNKTHSSSTTVTTTTTTTYEEINSDSNENKLRLDQSETEKLKHRQDKERKHTRNEFYRGEKSLSQADPSLKIKHSVDKHMAFDQPVGEDQQYRLHLYGLDNDDDISDVDVDWTDSRTAKTVSGSSSSETVTSRLTDLDLRKRPMSSGSQSSYTEKLTSTRTSHSMGRRMPWYLMIATFFTSLGSSISESVSGAGLNSMVASAADFIWTSVTTPSRWLLRSASSLASWLITQSYILLLWDVQAKHRKRRGCCCLLLPLLFLLPLCLLGGYYFHNSQPNSNSYLSHASQVPDSILSFLWFSTSRNNKVTEREIPVPQAPIMASNVDISQLNMTHIYQYIQQTVITAAADKKGDHPVGLTREQVEEMVGILLSAEMKILNSDINKRIESLKAFFAKDGSSFDYLEGNLKSLQHEVKLAAAAQLAMTESFESFKKSLESSKIKESSDWQTTYEAQQQKLLDLSAQVASLSSQNAALTALLTNCCRNNSSLVDIVRAQILATLSQMGTERNSPLAILVNQTTSQYVERSELDVKLAGFYSQIMDNLKVMLAPVDKETELKNETVLGTLDEMTVKNIVEEALIQFSADRVGMPDFALESSGGSVLSVRCSETFFKKTALVSIFGIPLWYTSNSPRTVIQPNVNPGECWAFKGATGYLVLQLSHPILPTGFTLEHIPRSLSPNGNISSAPKEFSVFGLASENDFDGVNLGNFTYLDNGKPIQFFPVQNQHSRIFQHIEFRILSNHGNEDYTCIYRFRVHGLP
ncbi:Secreted beta-glucosidase sun1 [Bulinus truncatus]|nr:Secreted beta-glucosidase sun1 [Bulinus truncatus]